MHRPLATSLLVLIGFLGSLAVPVLGQSRKLSGPLAPLPADEGGNRIFESVLSADGNWMVYRADHELSGNPRLYAVPSDGSAPAAPISPGDVHDFRISPAGDFVAFRDDADSLFLVAIDGSQAPVLVAPTASRGVFTPDGLELVYWNDGLEAIPVGGGPPRVIGGGADFILSEHGGRIVYRLRQQIDFYDIRDKLWSVPLDGSAAPVLLTPGSEVQIHDFRFSPDGARVVYSSGGFGADVQLYSVPSDASSAPVRLSHRPDTELDVARFQISRDSGLVAYTAHSGASGVHHELFRVAIDGGTSARLSPAPESGVQVRNFQLTADGLMAVFEYGGSAGLELHAVPLRGAGGLLRIDRPGVQSFLLAADGRHVVFSAKDSGELAQLYSARLRTSPRSRATTDRPRVQHAKRLNVTSYEDAELVTYDVGADPRTVFFTGRQDSDVVELFRVDVSGELPALRLNPPLTAGGDVVSYGYWQGIVIGAFHVDPAGRRIVYRADQETDELIELFSLPLDGSAPPRRLNPALPPSPTRGQVRAFHLDPDGQHVLYEADGGIFRINELYRAPLSGGAVQRLNQPLPPDVIVRERKTKVSPDGHWAVYQIEPLLFGTASGMFSVDLWSASSPVQLNAELPGRQAFDFQISADSQRIAFSSLSVTPNVLSKNIYSAPLDGSQPLLQLNSAEAGSGFQTLRLTPDGSRVVFSGYQDSTSGRELFSAPLDGSDPSAWIGPRDVMEPTHDLETIQIGPGGEHVAFLLYDGTRSVVELFGAPVDGSSPPVRLNGPLVARRNVTRFAVAGDRVVYLADEEVDDRFDLYSAPISGATPRVKLSGNFTSGNPGVLAFQVTPQGDRVLYYGQNQIHTSRGIYVMPTDGSVWPQRLCRAEVYSWTISPDGRHVVFTSDHVWSTVRELYSMPLDASRPLRRISSNLPPNGDVEYSHRYAVQVSPDSRTVVYLADQTVNDRIELYAVDIDGTQAPVVLNGPLAEGGIVGTYHNATVPPFLFTLDGQEVVYLAAQEGVYRTELFASPLP